MENFVYFRSDFLVFISNITLDEIGITDETVEITGHIVESCDLEKYEEDPNDVTTKINLTFAPTSGGHVAFITHDLDLNKTYRMALKIVVNGIESYITPEIFVKRAE